MSIMTLESTKTRVGAADVKVCNGVVGISIVAASQSHDLVSRHAPPFENSPCLINRIGMIGKFDRQSRHSGTETPLPFAVPN